MSQVTSNQVHAIKKILTDLTSMFAIEFPRSHTAEVLYCKNHNYHGDILKNSLKFFCPCVVFTVCIIVVLLYTIIVFRCFWGT